MRKPKITFDTEDRVYINPEGKNSIIGRDCAYAIEKMIDALIAVYHFEENTNLLDPETSIKIEQALKKAGCHDN